jgi:hypothetical protein
MSNPSQDRLRDYLFLDSALVTKFADQIRSSFRSTGEQLSEKLLPSSELNIYEKILLLEAYLEVQNELSQERPVEMSESIGSEQSRRFVKETMTATKVVLPVNDECPIDGLSHLAVWISDPDPSLYTSEEYTWRGTFLYLTEIHWEYAGFSTVHSGVSALQALMNQVSGKDFFHYTKEEFEPNGRGRDLHPVDKLKEIGGVASGPRQITSLYRKRYLTNEQAYSFEGARRRVNDLLAYPLYIAAAD